jgi:uncharacterized membrane protein YbhN (UPF0104 family)
MTLLKVSVTVLGMWLVLSNLDLAAVLAVIGQVQLGWLALGAALMLLSLIVRAYRWHLILHGVGSRMRFGRLVELYLIGSFFNAFLPSGLGGDVVRAAEAAQDVEPEIAVSTVFIDRLSGLMALFAMALAVLPFRPAEFPERLAWSVGLLCGLGLATGIVLLDGRLLHIVVGLLPPRIRALGDNFFDRLAAAISRCGWRALAGALLVSVLFNLMQVGWWAATGRALGLAVPFSYYLLVVPVMAIALLVPSIGGLGVRENLAPLLFAGAGISAEQAVALTLLVFGLERVASLLGAPVYLYSSLRRGPRREVDEPIHHA